MTNPVQSLADGYIRWLRSCVGSQLIYLVYSGAAIFDEAGRVLVQERYDFDWLSLPGGAMELGESLLRAAHREIREECGVEVKLHGLSGIYSHPRFNLHYPNGDDVQQWTACFWGEIAGGELRPDGGETLRLSFVEPEVLLARTHPAHEAMVRDALRARAGEPIRLEPIESFPPLKPYYPILREYIGHEAILLPGATALIEDEQGRLLSTYRTDFECWGLPGGFAELGETTTANVVREVREETGLEIEPYAIVGVYSDPGMMHVTCPNGDVLQGVGISFACRVVGGELVKDGNDSESSKVDFLPVEAIMAGACDGWVRQNVQDYFDRTNWPHVR